jgi:hypothetical protein
MPKELSPCETEVLEQWVAALRTALDSPDADLPLDDMLGLMARVARGTVRPAVPPTAYLLGFHVGRAAASGQDQQTALRHAITTVGALVPDPRQTPEED